MPARALTLASRHLPGAFELVPDADEETIQELWAHLAAYRASRAGMTTRTPTAELNGVDGEEQDEDGYDEDDEGSLNLSLVGRDCDPLIPSSAQINLVWGRGRATWKALVATAEKGWPTWLMDPSIMLKDIPALPHNIRGRRLSGRPVWRVPDVNRTAKDVYGADKHFLLSIPAPIECRMSDKASFYDRTQTSESATPKGLSILVLLWSYILSARLLELQGRRAVLHLPASASLALVRWLCALLSPQPGWETDNKHDFPPWAAFCCGDVNFAICFPMGEPMSLKKERAPTSVEARRLLVEFCCLYGLGPKVHGESGLLPPYTAALLATLALPYYRFAQLRPQLPIPLLVYSGFSGPPLYQISRSIKRLYDDIPYYMTLSLHPISISSMIWSIFWQPCIACNLVSPWLGAILSVIRPIIEARDLGQLARIFAYRRPRVSLMWLGIFLLGDITMLSRIVKYLETLEEDADMYCIGLPDLSVAAWTGSPQSFWDEEEDGEVFSVNADARAASLSRADVLRRRLNFRLGDNYSTLFAWQPFSPIPDREIEPDLREYVEQRNFRKYMYWTWLGISDNATAAEAAAAVPHGIKTAPSKRPTLDMVNFSIQDNKKKPYKCCYAVAGNRGCRTSPTHNFQLPKRALTHMESQQTPAASAEPKFPAVALDCEMAGIAGGAGEVILLCATDFVTGAVLVNRLVCPREKITQMRTSIHGIAKSTLDEAISEGQALAGWEEARSELWKYIDDKTILIGHSLEHDLGSLRMIHPRVVDSGILTENAVGQRRRFGLQTLCSELLKVQIRKGKGGIHDCLEDVLASREVVLFCIQARSQEAFRAWAEAKKRELIRLEKERKMAKEKKANKDRKKGTVRAGGGSSYYTKFGSDDEEVLHWSDIAEDLGWPHPDTGYDPWSD
ncbi:hypothetical protein NUW58_g2594 [Xylaria curta]|uniref:Uncharacterized protein n=1 Tax=Xylaria curta TaxID=42375 RepID=A0ACC1PGN0_9PEZI|nr:hypothetical protein NUW58_g2594 [Xylaria curta]